MKSKILLSLVFVMITFNGFSKIWRVNNMTNISANFSDVAAAITAAAAGDTLYIEGSQKPYGDISVTKAITLIGPGYFLGNTTQTQATALVAMCSKITCTAACTIMGLSVTGTVSINSNGVTIQRNLISGVISTANSGAVTYNNLTVTQNVVGGIQDYYSYSAFYQYFSGAITNNIILGDISFNGSTAYIANNVVNKINCSGSQIYNNIVFTSISANSSVVDYNIFCFASTLTSHNVNNVVKTTLFTAQSQSVDTDYQLATASPAKGVGTNGVDCGAFGADGTLPYVLSGIPPIPRIYEITSPSKVNQGDAFSVTIKAKVEY